MRPPSTTTSTGPTGGAPVPSIRVTPRITSRSNGPSPSPARRAGAGLDACTEPPVTARMNSSPGEGGAAGAKRREREARIQRVVNHRQLSGVEGGGRISTRPRPACRKRGAPTSSAETSAARQTHHARHLCATRARSLWRAGRDAAQATPSTLHSSARHGIARVAHQRA
jgi:hypothetical protein